MSKKLQVAGIINDSITDGPGLRLAVFTQGCKKRCKGCHNPKAQPFDGGYAVETDEILHMIKKNPLLSGVTFSGGEPFCQVKPFTVLAAEIKKLNLEIAVYTGYLFEELIVDEENRKLIELVDIIIDGEFVIEQRDISQKFKGSKNQRVIDAQSSLKEGKTIVTKSERWV